MASVLLENLGYNLAEFEIIPGRYFYNSGLTLGGYVNLYYNDYEKDLVRNTSNSRNYVFTGQGCTDLAQKSIMIGSDYFQSYKN